MNWRMPISKHGCPLLLCTIDLSNAVKHTTVNIDEHQMKWKHHTTCCSECSLTCRWGWDAKNSRHYRQHFLSNAYFSIHHMSRLEQARQNVQKKISVYLYGKLLFSGFDPGTCQATSALWILGAYSEKP